MALIIGIWATAFWAIYTVEKAQKKELKKQFKQTQNTFKTAQKLRYDRLVESAYLLAENSTFKANLELNDPASVAYSVNEFGRFMKIDIFIVVGRKGDILAKMGMPLSKTDNVAEYDEVQNALIGKEPALDFSWPNLKMINGELFHIVSVPVYAGRNNIIGAILLGTKFAESELNEIKNGHNFDVSFIQGKNLIASSNKNPDQKKAYLSFFNQYVAPENLAHKESGSFLMTEGSINSQMLFTFASSMGKGEEAYYMCSLPLQKAMSFSSTFAKYAYCLTGILTFGVLIMSFGRITRASSKKSN